MSLTFPTDTLKKPSGLTAIPNQLNRPAFGTLYGFDAQGEETAGFRIDVLDTHANILARTGDAVGVIAYGTDTEDIYVYDGASWQYYENTPPFSNTYSVEFDGTDDYIDAGSSPSSLIVEGLSIWFKPDVTYGSGTLGYLLSFGGSDYGIALGGDHFGPVTDEVITVVNANHLWSYTGSGVTLSANTWHHLGVRWESSSSSTNSGNAGYDIYLDGTKVGNSFGTYSSGNGSKITTSRITVGARNRSGTIGTYFFNGKIDEFSVFTSAISESDLLAIYNSGVPADLTDYSPTLWWRMGDNNSGSGTTITDQGSGGNDGTLTNGPTYSTDVPVASSFSNTYSADLDGTDDYIAVGSSGTVGTLSAWFKPDAALSASGRVGYLVGFNSTSGPYGATYAGIGFGNITGTLTNEIITFHTNDWMYAYADASATVSAAWHHVAVRWSGTEYEIYLDGSSVMNHSAQWGSASKAEIPYSSLNIGKRNAGTYFHQGLVDEVAVWHTALSASDITTLYNSGVPADISTLSPNGWWRMGDNDGGTGTTITDQGLGGNNGTLTNGPTFSTDVPT